MPEILMPARDAQKAPATAESEGRLEERRRVRAGTNVGELERWLSLLGGAALGLAGLTRGARALPLALLGGGLVYRGATGNCPLYKALGFSTAEPRAAQTSVRAHHGVKVEQAFTIARSPEDLYRYWRDFANLPRFMQHLEAVTETSAGRSHWVARGPLGMRFAWDAEIINEKPNELIAWRSLPGADVDTAGSVHFLRAPGGRGTAVTVALKYDPPAGALGASVARLFGQKPDQQIQEDLRRFKQLMEAGEIPTTEGQPRGQCCG